MEELLNQGTISPDSNVTNVRSFSNMLQNVKLLTIVELKRMPTMLNK